MKKILVIAGIGIVVLVLAFFTWQHFSQTSNVPSKPHVIQSTKNTESQQGSKVVKEDIKNEKISTKNIECTQSFFTKKLDRENSGELSDIVGMHIDSNKIKIIEEESKIPENYEEVRCDSYLSHFIPKIKENKISFERSALEMTVFCEIKALPENLPRFYEQNFIKTECNFTSPVEVNFIEKNIESKKEKILNKEAFKLPHSVCKNMIDDYTRNTCYRIYQEDIIRKSQLNSYQTAFSRLNYSFKKEDKNKYILEF